MKNNEFKGTMKEYMELEPIACELCDTLFPDLYPPTEKFNIKGKIIRAMHQHKQKHLLDIYLLGFNDELESNYNNTHKKDSLEYKAYLIGSNHAIIGDDVSSIDLLTDEEILKIINCSE